MKLHPFRLFMAGFLAAASLPLSAANKDLGNIMYVGDSITHGVNSGSYRWALHKIFTDNGISYNAEGIKTGNFSKGVPPGTTYGGKPFTNVHSSQASARAYEIAGRADGYAYGRFDGANIQNWLGQSTAKTKGGTYSGPSFTGSQAPGMFFMMIGTNDMLSDSGNRKKWIPDSPVKLLKDVEAIVDSMQKSNRDAKIVLISVPCWTINNHCNEASIHQAVADYNNSLKELSKKRKGIFFADINKGLLDVTSSTPFYGVESMFNRPADGIHPSAQGDLLIAGNIAKALELPGRTAGLLRKPANALTINFCRGNSLSRPLNSVQDLGKAGFTPSGIAAAKGTINMGGKGNSSLSYSWKQGTDTSRGMTLECRLALGNGAADGWNANDRLNISLGNGTVCGTLGISEGSILWGDTILYSMDMSSKTPALRMAYVPGDEQAGIRAGYYVWLDDMLIGEALPPSGISAACNGASINCNIEGRAFLADLALDGTGAYAPPVSGKK